jgi:hypothetical protein
VHPALIDAYLSGATIDAIRCDPLAAPSVGLSRAARGVLAFLERRLARAPARAAA